MSRSSRTLPETPPALALILAGTLATLVTLGAGCAGGPGFATAGALDEAARRRPDGVAVDPAGEPPRARESADASDRLVTLRTPLGADRAVDTVSELFRKIVIEDSDGLEALFTREATASNGSPGTSATPLAVLWWQQRFRRLDYTRLAGEPIFREAELEIYRAEDDVDALPHAAIHLETLGETDVVIRLPIVTSHAGADRLFGDEMIFWLRREGDRYKIYRVLEDFTLS
jgi:hypothetical protein